MNRCLVAVAAVTIAFARPAPSTAQPAQSPEVKALYDEGVRRYNIGDYDGAVDVFKRAYLKSNAPSLLFNIAQAYRKKGAAGCEQALEAYRTYLRERPDTQDRPKVERLIDEIDPCPVQPVTPPAPTPVVPAPAPAPERSTGPSGPQLALAIGGVTLIVGGGVLLGVTASRYGTLKDECPCPRDRWTTWRDAEYASYAALGVGAASLTAAIIWWVAGRSSEREPMTTLRVVPSTNGAVVTGTF